MKHICKGKGRSLRDADTVTKYTRDIVDYIGSRKVGKECD